jgi:casein kinase II subunit alpha
MFKKEPFFKGSDNIDQLVQIVNVMGYADMKEYMSKYKPVLENFPFDKIINKTKRKFESFINKDNRQLCDRVALDLLEKMLVFDHALRITAKDAMEHPYFEKIKSILI